MNLTALTTAHATQWLNETNSTTLRLNYSNDILSTRTLFLNESYDNHTMQNAAMDEPIVCTLVEADLAQPDH